jgi:dTDP-4-amino-4,6-dideoxygalactose transaminase
LSGPDAAARRDLVLRSLERHSIEARPVWKPMHHQPLFRGEPYFTAGKSDVSGGLFEAGICLPSGSNLSAQQQDRVIEQLRRALALAKGRRAAA